MDGVPCVAVFGLRQLQKLVGRHAEMLLQLARRLGGFERDGSRIGLVPALVVPMADDLNVGLALVPGLGGCGCGCCGCCRGGGVTRTCACASVTGPASGRALGAAREFVQVFPQKVGHSSPPLLSRALRATIHCKICSPLNLLKDW